MDETVRTVKIYERTRRLLKILAAQNNETMMQVMDRLVKAELERQNSNTLN